MFFTVLSYSLVAMFVQYCVGIQCLVIMAVCSSSWITFQMLPKEELYMPPLNIRVRDHRQFGRKPTVGIHVLKSLEKFRMEPIMQGDMDMDDTSGTKHWLTNLKHPFPCYIAVIKYGHEIGCV